MKLNRAVSCSPPTEVQDQAQRGALYSTSATAPTGGRNDIPALLEKPPPQGYARWTGPLLTKALDEVDVQYNSWPESLILTNRKVTGDGIGPRGDLLPEFPYLGPPHDDSRQGNACPPNSTSAGAIPSGVCGILATI
jgi:hypothetical protein